MENKKKGYWFSTESGAHIFVEEGQSKEQAMNKTFDEKEQDFNDPSERASVKDEEKDYENEDQYFARIKKEFNQKAKDNDIKIGDTVYGSTIKSFEPSSNSVILASGSDISLDEVIRQKNEIKKPGGFDKWSTDDKLAWLEDKYPNGNETLKKEIMDEYNERMKKDLDRYNKKEADFNDPNERESMKAEDKYEDYKEKGKSTWNQKLSKGDKVVIKDKNGNDMEAYIGGFYYNQKLQDEDTYENDSKSLVNDFRGIQLVDKDGKEIGNINANQILKHEKAISRKKNINPFDKNAMKESGITDKLIKERDYLSPQEKQDYKDIQKRKQFLDKSKAKIREFATKKDMKKADDFILHSGFTEEEQKELFDEFYSNAK